jgi:hypothetical protein
MMFIKFTAGVAFTCGISMSANAQLIVAHTQLIQGNLSNSHPYPFLANGDLAGHEWQGARHDSLTKLDQLSPNQSGVVYKGIDWLEKDFTLNMWFTPQWDTPLNNLLAELLCYTSPFSTVILGILGGDFFISATDIIDNQPISLSYNTPTMLTITKGGVGAFRVFVNGVLFYTPPISVHQKDFLSGGNLEIGRDSNMVFDGLKIYDTSLSSEDIANIYNNEKTLKENGEALSNGLPAFYSEVGGRVGSMEGFNIQGGVQVTSHNTIILTGTVGDGSSDVKMDLKSLDNIPVNRLVTTSISEAKQFLYSGNLYIDFEDTDEIDPTNGVSVNMKFATFRKVPDAFPQNSLQPGESASFIFSVGNGGQAGYNEYHKATQRPRLLAGKNLTPLYKIINFSPTEPNGNFTTEALFGYGLATPFYRRGLIGNVDAGGGIALVNYLPFIISEKNLMTGADNLVFGLTVANNANDQTFVAFDTIHLVKDAKVFAFLDYEAANEIVTISTGSPPLVRNTSGVVVNVGATVSDSPFIIKPANYVYIPFDFAEYEFNNPFQDQNEGIRKKVEVALWLTPTYKY